MLIGGVGCFYGFVIGGKGLVYFLGGCGLCALIKACFVRWGYLLFVGRGSWWCWC